MHDCGYPPGDEKDPDRPFVRVCAECGKRWICTHARLGLWTEFKESET